MKREDIARVAKSHNIGRVRNADGKLDYPDKLYEFAEAITFFAGNDYHQLIKHLVRGLINVQTRSSNESALIASVYLKEAEEIYGLLEYHE